MERKGKRDPQYSDDDEDGVTLGLLLAKRQILAVDGNIQFVQIDGAYSQALITVPLEREPQVYSRLNNLNNSNELIFG